MGACNVGLSSVAPHTSFQAFKKALSQREKKVRENLKINNNKKEYTDEVWNGYVKMAKTYHHRIKR